MITRYDSGSVINMVQGIDSLGPELLGTPSSTPTNKYDPRFRIVCIEATNVEEGLYLTTEGCRKMANGNQKNFSWRVSSSAFLEKDVSLMCRTMKGSAASRELCVVVM